MQHETGVTDVVDPLAGSYYVEKLTSDIADQAWAMMQEVERLGGMTKAIEAGYPKAEIEREALRRQAMIDSGQSVIVGVNKFQRDENDAVDVLDIDNADVRQRQLDRLATLKATRDADAVSGAVCPEGWR